MAQFKSSARWLGISALVIGLMAVHGLAWGQAPYKIKIPTVLSYELNLPSLVAHAKGYFAEDGVEITDFVLGSGGTQRAAVIAREFDIGLFGFVHVPIARIAGSLWKAVLSTHDREIFSLVVRNELKGKIKEVADLKGRKVGFSTPGASSWYMGSLFLKKAGLDPEKDLEYVSLGGDPGVIYTSLKTGKVDAFSAWEPTTTRVIEDGVAFPLVRIWDPQEHKKWIGEKALSMMVITREDVIKGNPDMVRRVVNAHKKGLAFIRSQSAAEIADVVLKNRKTAEQFKGLSQPVVVKMLDRIKPGFGDGCLSRSGFDVEMKLAVEYKLVKRAITFEEFADSSFAGACL
jgi:ABC-type nitrate/sulfonate/bicarbonate transport system substrate-binding protein